MSVAESSIEHEASAPSGQNKRLCFVCTHSFTLATLYKGLFPYFHGRGYEIDVIVGDREYQDFDPEHFGPIRPIVIPMRRQPSPLHDLLCLARLTLFFARRRYGVIHVSTPKASLLAGLAAKLTRAGPVVFVHRRCVYERMTGIKRRFYEGIDRLICRLADAVLPISLQLAGFLVSKELCDLEKIRIIGRGSSNGIDTQRFRPSPLVARRSAALREELAIAPSAKVLLFVGRFCSEKGVDHLPGVLERVRARVPEAVLVAAGPLDARDPVAESTLTWFAEDGGARRVGFVPDPRALYDLCDVFVFPSFFEGFGNVLLEAAAHERPAVAFDVPGVNEAVADGFSGWLAPIHDEAAMADRIVELLQDDRSRRSMGLTARQRVVTQYRQDMIWREIEEVFESLAPSIRARQAPMARRA